MKRTLTGVDKIGFEYGDGAYDQMQCYEEFSRRGGKPIIPPRKGSRDDKVVWTIAEQLRDINIKVSRETLGEVHGKLELDIIAGAWLRKLWEDSRINLLLHWHPEFSGMRNLKWRSKSSF